VSITAVAGNSDVPRPACGERVAPEAPGEGRCLQDGAPHPPLRGTFSPPGGEKALSLRPLAIPNEHGGWGFLFEPIVLAALAAPSLAGALVAVAAIAAFLARHPLKLAAGDLVRGRRYPRTIVCARIAAAYLIVALIAIVFVGWRPLLPLAIAAPFGIVQLAYDARNRGRAALPELSGAIAMGGVAASMALASSTTLAFAAALWLLALCRSLPAILYVRQLLGRGRGAIAAHAVAVAAAALLWRASLAPIVAVIATIALLMRALRPPSQTSPKKIGLAELVWGGAATLATGTAYLLR